MAAQGAISASSAASGLQDAMAVPVTRITASCADNLNKGTIGAIDDVT